jgi:anti-sigma B factor antagonist
MRPRTAADLAQRGAEKGCRTYLSVSVRERGQSVVVEVDGELDLASAPELERALRQAWLQERGLVVVDLTDLRFIDMAGLRSLLTAQQQAEQEGRQLLLANVPDAVRRVMALAHVDEVLAIMEDPPKR